MTDLHKAAQQALDALELFFASVLPYDQAGEPTIPDKANAAANTAITALREALANPAVPKIDYTVIHAFSESQSVSYNETCAMVRNALAAAPQPKDKP